LFKKTKKYEDAIAKYKYILENIDCNNIYSIHGISKSYYEIGNLDESIKYINYRITLETSNIYFKNLKNQIDAKK